MDYHFNFSIRGSPENLSYEGLSILWGVTEKVFGMSDKKYEGINAEYGKKNRAWDNSKDILFDNT